MIKPNKYTDVNHSILEYSSIILEKIFMSGTEKYNDLFNHIVNIKGENTRYMMLPALNFLFLLGKIEYDAKADTIKFIK